MLTRIQQSDSSRCQSSDSEEKGEDQRTLPWPTGISDVKKRKKKQGGKKESRGRSKEGIQRLQRQSIRRHNRRKRRRPIQDLPALCALQSSSSQRLRLLFFRVFLLFLQVRDQRFLSCLIYAKVVCSICSSHLRVIFASEIEL